VAQIPWHPDITPEELFSIPRQPPPVTQPDRTTWRRLIAEQTDEPIFNSTGDLDLEFTNGNGHPFQAWTATYVLFPMIYNNNEWAGCAHRNPTTEPLDHQGGY